MTKTDVSPAAPGLVLLLETPETPGPATAGPCVVVVYYVQM